MDKEKIIELYELLAANKATPEEHAEFERLLNGEDAELTLKEYWSGHWDRITTSDEENVLIKNYESIFEHIIAQPQNQKIKRSSWLRYAAAASIIFCLSVAGYFILHKKEVPNTAAVNTRQDIAPGRNQAILTLSTGRQIVLTEARNGKLAQQGNAAVTKTADGQIVYRTGAGSATTEVSYNTTRTPRGGQFQIVLADGTRVWLNAASSITYPTAFTGADRQVEITGEVYFEVMHSAAKPFRVKSRGQIVEDIGTHFNINAYDDEPAIKTTLIEGSVRINHDVILAPGQQAIIQNGIIKVGNVNTDQAIAWKNGLFSFKRTPMSEVMRQLSRWYNVDVEYPNGPPKTTFTGDMHRNINASKVLDVLSYFKVHFQIVVDSGGKKIIVKP